MKNKKIRISILVCLFCIEILSLFLTMKSFSNKPIEEIKEINEVDKKHFSMFINDGAGNYSEITNTNLFPQGYRINTTKSSCIDTKGNVIEGILSGAGNSITVTSTKTAYCYLYFDEAVDVTINVTTNGTSGLPTINKYKAELTCNDATATYSNKYHRVEFNTVTSDGVNCNLIYVNDTNSYTTLIDEVESKANDLGSAIRIDSDDDATYTTLSDSDYSGNYTMFSGSYSSTSGTTNTNAFTLSNGVFTSVPENLTSNTYYHVLYTIPSGTNDANYQVCYTIPSSSDGYSTSNILYIYKGSTNAISSSYISLSSTAKTDVCEDIGVMSAGEKINITQRAYTTIAPISFYIKKTEDLTFKDIEIGYRYTGKQPDNYIWYNNELWRIIGSIPTCMDSSCSTQTNLVKIMRAESIGGLSYHSRGANTTWGSGNTLYTLLNEYYYGKKDATGASPCLGFNTSTYALCNYTTKGISSDENDYYGRMIESVYMNAGTVSSTSSTIDAAYTLETATLTSSATKVGLMTSSDYGFATSGITYSSVGLSSSSYEQNNWIYEHYVEWTMTPNSTTFVLGVYLNGNVTGNYAYYGNIVRPVIYLDSSVYVINGTGEENNPYILGM